MQHSLTEIGNIAFPSLVHPQSCGYLTLLFVLAKNKKIETSLNREALWLLDNNVGKTCFIMFSTVCDFRFDLATVLARESNAMNHLSAFFDIIHQDPIISQVKLLAEPWDLGEGGYQLGKFPTGWAEWNGKYRDCVRDYWRGGHGVMSEFADRFTGSADLYRVERRGLTASINFLTAHDGFTLNDLVTYNEKHNHMNGEDNNDGESYNRSWNCGVEGPTDDPAIKNLRDCQKRNFLTTLLLSQGVPMLVAGLSFFYVFYKKM
jgi:isoamylase